MSSLRVTCTLALAAALPGACSSSLSDDEGDADATCAAPSGGLPNVCPPRGLFDAPVTVRVVAADPSASIVYTLDGTTPTAASGTRYKGAIQIAGTPDQGVVVLQAAVLGGDGKAGRPAVHSYVFPDMVLMQSKSPPRMPALWTDPAGKSTPADYEMDPHVVAANRAPLLAAFKALPTLALTFDHDDLWDPAKGIYMNASKDGPEWERHAFLEFIPSHGPHFQIDCGVHTQGGSSQQDWKVPKVSLKANFRAAYGASKLDYPMFAGSPVTKFDGLVLDAHLNFTWLHPFDENQRTRAVYFRDALVADLQRAAGSFGPHNRFVHLYLNGLYWGIYDMHERPDEHYASDYFGGAAADYDVVKHDPAIATNVVNGDINAYTMMFQIARRGLADDANYKALQQFLDVDDFIDYMLVNFYAGNLDWDYSNWYAARRRAPGAGFHFFSWDAEWTFFMVDYDVTPANFSFVGGMVTSMNKPRELYWALHDNPDFLARVNKRADELLTGDGPLTPAKVRALFDQRLGEVRPAILLESARWGDTRRPDRAYGLQEYDAEVQFLEDMYLPARSKIVRAQIK